MPVLFVFRLFVSNFEREKLPMKNALALSFVSLAALPAYAGLAPHVGDVGVKFENGRIITTIVEEAEEGRDGELGLPQRVFDSDLGTIEFGPFGNDEPGYTSDELPAGVQLGFNIRAALKKWDGSGFVVTDATLQLGQFVGTPGETTRQTGAGFVSGFDFVTVDNTGFIDEHLSHILSGPGGTDPANGVYLLELELTTTAPGIAPSEPYWIVFNLNLDQSVQDEAIDYVERNLVPAPGAVMLAGLGGLVAMRRRRA